jgi:regulatory protein
LDREPSAYLDALRLLARRELSVARLRARLIDRGHPADEIERAIEHLIETRAVDDARLARAYAANALKIKRRGRLRIQRELHALGIDKDVVTDAVAETFGDVDERALIRAAVDRKLRGRRTIDSPADYARVAQFLLRQGFSPAAITAVLRARRKGTDPLE